jgi:hypothetical protein
VDQCARTPRTPTTSPAHAPQLPFEHCPHPISLSCLISRKLTLSRALPLPLALAGDPHPPYRPSSPPEAALSLHERRPKVRNSLPSSVSLNSTLPWLFCPCRRSVAPARRPRVVPGQIGPVLSPCVSPWHSPSLVGASPSLSVLDSPSPRMGFLAGVTPTHPKLSLCRSLALGLGPEAGTPPPSSSGPSHRS